MTQAAERFDAFENSPAHATKLVALPSTDSSPARLGVGRIAKRTVDLLAAGIILLLTAPVFLAAMLAIKLTSRGPVFYRQIRLGLGAQPIAVWKLRTMYVDADQRRDEILHLNESENVLFFKVKDDPRITPVGRLLRKLSIDELPQLFNVLTGSMSLVGPRPLPGELHEYEERFLGRMTVKPGITGLWQVSGRSELSAEQAFGLDLHYVDNWTLRMDIGIILRTVLVVLRGSGAY
jgi:lipopolysaccharide/colanic/teichoic acid biosynthesis glycosyltransferase